MPLLVEANLGKIGSKADAMNQVALELQLNVLPFQQLKLCSQHLKRTARRLLDGTRMFFSKTNQLTAPRNADLDCLIWTQGHKSLVTVRQLDWQACHIPLVSANIGGATPLDISERARNDQIVDKIEKKTVDIVVSRMGPAL